MRKTTYFAVLVFCFLHFFTASADTQPKIDQRVRVEMVTDEADAVLSILAKKQTNSEITDSDWDKIFASEGYVRLKKRELSLRRPFEDREFKNFVLSDALFERREALAQTLTRWKLINISKVAERPLSYLPKNSVIHAKIYPVIKPRENSFVFEIRENPAIFLYLDPDVANEKLENTLAHELHHIGFGTACPPDSAAARIKGLTENSQKVLRWVGAFGEGFAMLAAAGGPDIHPHAVSLPEERARWDVDAANFAADLRTLEKFFIDLSDGKLSDEDETKTASSFYGVQGPWYTVGWRMAVVIEKTFGRKTLANAMCDQRKLLVTYNKAAQKYSRSRNEKPVLWSEELIKRLR